MNTYQDKQNSNLLFLTKFNEQHRLNARIISLTALFVLSVFAYWDIQSLGIDHPEIPELLLIRFCFTLPIILLTYFAALKPLKRIRLDLFMTLCVTTIILTIIAIHWKYFLIGITLSTDSIVLSLVVIYFLPNIFYWQKITVGLLLIGFYFLYLFLTRQPMDAFIHSGVYLSCINIAGLIHSVSFDKERRANFDKTQFLRVMAQTDQLTGASNRHKFDEHFSKLLEQGKLENKGIALAIADIDFFKQYNDLYGHFTGDECLIKVAQAFLTLKRHPLDSCIRFGGEEFILIKYGVNLEQTIQWGQKIIDTIYNLDIPHQASDAEQRITVSAGLIHWEPGSPLTRTQLMKLADEALYKAKGNGRNQVQVHLNK